MTKRGRVKLLDFGLAKLLKQDVNESITRASADLFTVPGTTLGTIAYMSPEQAQGEETDHKTDIWAWGVVFYEMLTGQRPFQGKNDVSVLHSIVNSEPASLRQHSPAVPRPVEQIVMRALGKNPQSRYSSAAEIRKALTDYKTEITASALRVQEPLRKQLRRPAIAVPIALAVLLLVSISGWFWWQARNVTWAREQLLKVEQLAQKEDFGTAFEILSQAAKVIPDDPAVQQWWNEVAIQVSIETEPSQAEVFVRPYSKSRLRWQLLGKSPLKEVRVARQVYALNIVREGFLTVETVQGASSGELKFKLHTLDAVPVGMVPIEGGTARLPITAAGHLDPVPLQGFAIDKYEVTNEQFKKFVDAGGYTKRQYWKQPFINEGKTLPWEEAIKFFVDSTGRPGPATWELRDYPKGQAAYPVRGVSWYEAAAYAEFVERSLPTLYHWSRSANPPFAPQLVAVANFGSSGPVPVGQQGAWGPSGTHDMAGNVKEWCWNEANGRRYIMGGAWNEPVYMFNNVDARSPFSREPNFGFRCADYLDKSVPSKVFDEIGFVSRDLMNEKPASDELFQVYRSLYSYDKTDLEIKTEPVDSTPEDWSLERLSYRAAYASDRIPAFFFIPKNGKSPYQVIMYFPHAGSIGQRSNDPLQMNMDFLIRSGRAVLYPIYKGTHARGGTLETHYPQATTTYRDTVIQIGKDFQRSLDYLETRKDIVRDKIGYFGPSWGATMGAIMPALDERIKAAVLVVGGFYLQNRFPEVDQLNFAPRVRIPVLMLNGRFDWIFPYEASQLPMFKFLGSAPDQKRHLVYETGHSIPRNQLVKETLDWFDRYLGPVQ